MMNFDDFTKSIGLRADGLEHDTVAGFVLAKMDRFPRVADQFETDGFRFEVVDMDGRRLDKVLVSRVAGGQPGRSGMDGESR
jgi:putative hemolysin